MTPRRAPAAVALLLLAACSGETPRQENAPTGTPTQTTPPAPAAGEAAAPPDARGRRDFRYTSLEECELVRENREEGGFSERLCPGLGGYRLRLTESDLRQNLAVIAPDGSETSLELGRIGGGGFSTLGGKVEWRGAAAGDGFRPEAFIVRFQVAEEPYPAPETSYLLAVRLTPRPCVAGKIAPGPAQNRAARSAADEPGPCLA